MVILKSTTGVHIESPSGEQIGEAVRSLPLSRAWSITVEKYPHDYLTFYQTLQSNVMREYWAPGMLRYSTSECISTNRDVIEKAFKYYMKGWLQDEMIFIKTTIEVGAKSKNEKWIGRIGYLSFVIGLITGSIFILRNTQLQLGVLLFLGFMAISGSCFAHDWNIRNEQRLETSAISYVHRIKANIFAVLMCVFFIVFLIQYLLRGA